MNARIGSRPARRATRRRFAVIGGVSAATAAIVVATTSFFDGTPTGETDVHESRVAAPPRCTAIVRPDEQIGRAINRLRPGAVLCLAPGALFAQDVTIRVAGEPARPVTVRSGSGRPATVRGRVVVTGQARHIVISRLILDGRNERGLPSPSISGRDVLLEHNDITNRNTGICVLLGSTQGFGIAQRVTLRANRIHHCGRLPATNRDHGVYVEAARGTRIVGNLIHDNADRGVQLYPDARGTVVSGNVIDRNGVGVIFSGDGTYASSGNLVTRNVITNSRDRHDVEAFWPSGGPVGLGNRLVGNCVGGGRRGAIGPQVGFAASGNTVGTVVFAERHGFRVSSPSACAAFTPRGPVGPA